MKLTPNVGGLGSLLASKHVVSGCPQMVARSPDSDMLVRPLIAMTRPVCGATDTDVPPAALDQMLMPLGAGHAAQAVSSNVLMTELLFPLSMKMAAPLFGFGFGTATGSEFELDVCCIKQTRE